MKIDKVFFETIASYSDFYEWIESQNFEFSAEEFHNAMIEKLFSEGKLSSRYSKEFCEDVIANRSYASNSYWDDTREYHVAILEFMKDYELETIRFNFD